MLYNFRLCHVTSLLRLLRGSAFLLLQTWCFYIRRSCAELEPTELKSVNLIGPYTGSIFRRARAGSIEPALMRMCRARAHEETRLLAWQLSSDPSVASSSPLVVTSRQPRVHNIAKELCTICPFEL